MPALGICGLRRNNAYPYIRAGHDGEEKLRRSSLLTHSGSHEPRGTYHAPLKFTDTPSVSFISALASTESLSAGRV